jgi:hypothetical protein
VPLPAGERLNGYEILSLVGAGGMGEVYRARDTRLNREVALKILPPQMADNASAFARFEREAQAVAALSHPNILAVHDFGSTDRHRYVVFELLQGSTLRERLDGGPLPVRKAVDYARQTADGLAAAHARNITHRDVKPDNLFVTDEGRVKILDFGLAQTVLDAANAEVTSARTQAPITDAGTVLGTVGYMAPEQIRGLPVDHRADLFALGATLYEMCTGRRAFKGATPADTMSAVLTSDPPELSGSGHATPPALDRIVRRCLEKQPTERFQSARDLSFALDALSSLSGTGSGSTAVETTTAARRRGWALPAMAAAVAALTAGVVLGRLTYPTAAPYAPAPSLRAAFPYASPMAGVLTVAVSPDGRRLVFSDLAGPGAPRLFMRELATGLVDPVPESAQATSAVWSPRGDAVLFSTARELRLYTVGERTTRVVDMLANGFRGAAWLADDTLVLTFAGNEPVRRRNLSGGAPTVIVKGTDGPTLTLPRRIGQRTDFVIAVRSKTANALDRQLVTIRLSDGEVTPLIRSVGAGVVASGYLLAPLGRGLFAYPFDSERLTITGEPLQLPENVAWDPPTGDAAFSASDAGVLAYLPTADRQLQFEWLSNTGQPLTRIGPPDLYGAFSLSPDGSRIVARLLPSAAHPRAALRLIDVERNVASPIATPEGLVSDPVWTIDGSRIVYRLTNVLMRQSPFAATSEKLADEDFYPDAFSPDGRWLLVGRPEMAGGLGLLAKPMDGSGDAQPISTDASTTDEASFSPNSRLVSYHNSRTGRAEVYLSPFPPTGERWQVSPDGGVQPRWGADGRTLYYLDQTGKLLRVSVSADTPPRISRPDVMFDSGLGQPSSIIEEYAVHGNRFLFLRPATDAPPQAIAVLSNWTNALPATSAAVR